MTTIRTTGRSLVALALALSLGLFARTAWPDTEDNDGAVEPPPPPANTAIAGMMMRVGLGADSLCGAGVRASDVGSIMAAARTQHDLNPILDSLDLSFAQAKTDTDRLRRSVRSGRGRGEDVATLAQRKAGLENATAARQACIDGLRSAGLASLDAGARLTVETIYENSSWHFPTQYLVKDRPEAGWVALRDALAAKRISENYDEPFAQSAQDRLSAVDAEAQIATAKVNLDTYLAAVQTAWNAAVTE
jgi:hypothetical protein